MSCMKFCALNPKICWYYHLPSHYTTANVLLMVALITEIMDQSVSIQNTGYTLGLYQNNSILQYLS
jgi:hypothetical protein